MIQECQVSEQLKKGNKNTKTTIINKYILGRHSSFKGVMRVIIWLLRRNFWGYTKLKNISELVTKFRVYNIKASFFFLVEKIAINNSAKLHPVQYPYQIYY